MSLVWKGFPKCGYTPFDFLFGESEHNLGVEIWSEVCNGAILEPSIHENESPVRMEVFKPKRLLRKKVSPAIPVVQHHEAIAPVQSIREPLVNAVIDAWVPEAVAANKQMHMSRKMLPKRSEEVAEKSDTVELFFYYSSGKERWLPIFWSDKIPMLIVGMKCIRVWNRVLPRPSGKVVKKPVYRSV